MPKIIKGITLLELKIEKVYAHIQIIVKHSAQFQVYSIKDVTGVVSTSSDSAMSINLSKIIEKNS